MKIIFGICHFWIQHTQIDLKSHRRRFSPHLYLRCLHFRDEPSLNWDIYSLCQIPHPLLGKKAAIQVTLDMRPLPRARVKLGGWTRSPHFWWKKPFDPCDPKSKFEPISFEEGSTWCICMSYIDKVRNIEEIMHFLVKIKVWPLWPQMTPGWPMTP